MGLGRDDFYVLDLAWAILTVFFILLFISEWIFNKIGLGEIHENLRSFGKTRKINFYFDVPKRWFWHFYLLASVWGTWIIYRWFYLPRTAENFLPDFALLLFFKLFKNTEIIQICKGA